MSFILSSLVAIIGGLAFALSCLSLAGFAFSSVVVINGDDNDDAKMIRDTTFFLFLFFATVTHFTF